MNIEEARKVLWLKNNHRPLGELLDEGCLTKENLEWAAQWAYNPKLLQAARVLLETKNYPIPAETKKQLKESNIEGKEAVTEVGMSFQEARSTLWPFSSHKDQPMGELVDSKQLSLKDLGYAIETAWNPKVRQAATTLALVKLNQVVKEPAPPAGFVHVVSGGRSYSEQEQRRLAFLQGVFLGVLLAVWLGCAVWLLTNPFENGTNTAALADLIATPGGVTSLIIALIFLVIVAWLVYFIPDWFTKRLDKQIEYHHRGQEGEDLAVQNIVQALDGNWHLFRNVNLPGQNKGDLDLVLVGPSGVWVLEVKNFRGNYRNIGDHWYFRQGKRWKALSKSPSKQARNNAYRLKNFLKADRLNSFVNDAIVWANQESHLFVENPATTIWRINRLADELGNIWQGEKLSKSEQNKIVEKLTKLCELQKKSHS